MKRLFTFTIALAMCISMFPQAKSLTVDCQTPGWLSSKINYDDQQTVENLKVTGFLNSADLFFIGSLIKSHILRGEIDLSESRIAKDDTNSDDMLTGNFLGITGDLSYSVRVIRLPNKLKNAKGLRTNCLNIDSLFFNVKATPKIGVIDVQSCQNFFWGEDEDSIPDGAFDSGSRILGNMFFSPSVKYIGSRAFRYCNVKSVNIANLYSLEILGRSAFPESKMDTIILPRKLKEYSISSFDYKTNNEGKIHIFVHNDVKKIDNQYTRSHLGGTSGSYWFTEETYRSDFSNFIFHMKQTVPPSFAGGASKYPIVYVPKGAKTIYEAHSFWKNCTIIEENPLTSLRFDPKTVSVEASKNIFYSIIRGPYDADDTFVIFSVSDESIIKMEYKYGSEELPSFTAMKPGKAKIYVRAVSNPLLCDSMEVTVIQHVTGIKLDRSSVVMTKLGETTKLNAIISPEDATDKSVKWSSSNETVCLVQDGTLIAVGYGTSIVIATTNDGGYVATCVVTVTPYLYDLNGDGKVSTADIQIIINEMKKPQAEQNSKYDLNGDGKISTADIQMIINEMKN